MVEALETFFTFEILVSKLPVKTRQVDNGKPMVLVKK
jgi:hypothetical protein